MSHNEKPVKKNNDIPQHKIPKTIRQTSGNTMIDTSASRDRIAKLESIQNKDKKPKSFNVSPPINQNVSNIITRERVYSLSNTNSTELQKIDNKRQQQRNQKILNKKRIQKEYIASKSKENIFDEKKTNENQHKEILSPTRLKYTLFDRKGTEFNFELYKWLKPIKFLGSGAYASVCKVINTYTKKQYAIKKNQNLFINVIEAKRILREIKLMKHFNHPNIMNLCDVIPPEQHNKYSFNECYLIIPCMDFTLKKVISSKQELTEKHKQWIIYQITRGLEYMHSGGIIHRDIKPDNILLNAYDCSLKIIDFGLSRGIKNIKNNYSKDLLTEYVVTRWYRAPEIMCCSGNYDYKIDCWSLGCIVAELYTRMPIFRGRNYIEQIQLYLQWIDAENDLQWITNVEAKNWVYSVLQQQKEQLDLKELLINSNEISRDFIRNILVLNPNKRPDASSILKHEWMKGFFKQEDYKKCRLFSMEYEQDNALKHIFGVRDRIYNELHDFHNNNNICGVRNTFGSNSKPSCA